MAAFPSTTGTSQDSLDAAWTRARNVAATVKSKAQALRASISAGPVGSSQILNFITFLADARLALQRSASTSGIVAYAQAQIANPTFDVVASFNSMLAALDAVVANVLSTFPKDIGSGCLLAVLFTIDNTGRTQDRQFSGAQTSALGTALDTLIAAID